MLCSTDIAAIVWEGCFKHPYYQSQKVRRLYGSDSRWNVAARFGTPNIVCIGAVRIVTVCTELPYHEATLQLLHEPTQVQSATIFWYLEQQAAASDLHSVVFMIFRSMQGRPCLSAISHLNQLQNVASHQLCTPLHCWGDLSGTCLNRVIHWCLSQE